MGGMIVKREKQKKRIRWREDSDGTEFASESAATRDLYMQSLREFATYGCRNQNAVFAPDSRDLCYPKWWKPKVAATSVLQPNGDKKRKKKIVPQWKFDMFNCYLSVYLYRTEGLQWHRLNLYRIIFPSNYFQLVFWYRSPYHKSLYKKINSMI